MADPSRKVLVTADVDPALERVREQIVKAARACFIRFGTEKTSMSDVAKEAGVSRGTVYRYFRDRSELIQGVFAYESRLFHDGVRRQLDRFETLEQQIVEYAGILAAFTHDIATGARNRIELSRERLALLLTSHSKPLLRGTIDLLVPYIEAAIERGEVREDLHARHAAEWLARMLFTVSSMPSVTFNGSDPKAWRRFFREHALRGLSR